MCKVTMRQVHQMRKYILEGFSVKDIAEHMDISMNIVRNYTKAERLRIKEKHLHTKVEMVNNDKLAIAVTETNTPKVINITAQQINFFEEVV